MSNLYWEDAHCILWMRNQLNYFETTIIFAAGVVMIQYLLHLLVAMHPQ